MRFDPLPADLLIDRDRWPELIINGQDHPHVQKEKQQGVQASCESFAPASCIEYLRSVARLPYIPLDAAEMFSRLPEPIGGGYMATVIEEAMTNGYKPTGKIVKVWDCPTFDHMMSASIYGWPLTINFLYYLNYIPNSTGWVPKGKGTPETHAIMGFRPAVRARVGGTREYGIRCLNSRTPWRMTLSEDQLTKPVGSGGAFAIVSILDEGH